MNLGWNPGRRNRNAGTAAHGHGHGQDNALVIPDPSRGHLAFFEQLANPVLVCRRMGGIPMRFYVQAPSPGWFDPCSVDDICRLLALCPVEDWRSIDLIVLRQPTRKQRVLRPVWGRAVFSFRGVVRPGPAVILEAQTLDAYRWPVSLSVEDTRELEHLRADGHEVRREQRHWRIAPSVESLRFTQLFRTLLHEIGHHVDYQQCIAAGKPWAERDPASKEQFAHRYAEELFARLRLEGAVPFSATAVPDEAAAEGLMPAWFSAPG